MIQRETSTADARTHRRFDGPVRTCVGCRKRELAAELIRVVAVAGGNGTPAVTVDTVGCLPGRGAWLHPAAECLRTAVRRGAFARALRIAGSPDTSGVAEHLELLGQLTAPGNRTGSEEHEHTVKTR